MLRFLLPISAVLNLCGILSLDAAEETLFDQGMIHDTSNLEVSVLQDWQSSKKDPSIRQKLIEITVCEWWPGQKVRLPVTLNAPADGGPSGFPCRNVVVANQPLSKRVSTPTGGQLALLREHGVGVVLIGMGTIDAMEPAGQLHHGMREHLLKTKNPRYTPAWIWGMSQMRALTAAMTESEVFQPEKVLTTGGSKRGVAAAVAGIHDDRFTAILPVVAPPLGNPGAAAYVMGTEPEHLARIDEEFYKTLKPGVATAMRERAGRRAANRVTLEQARAAGWSEEDIAGITDRAWDACRVTKALPELKKRGLDIFYNVGTNDSVTPALLELGEKFPDFPICIVPGGQHGGPATAGFTKRVPQLPEVQGNFFSFAKAHFFGSRELPAPPGIEGTWEPENRCAKVSVTFSPGAEPDSNVLWWNVNRSNPYTLPFEYDEWQSVEMERVGPGEFNATISLPETPDRLDFLSLHSDTKNDLPITISSPYRRIELHP